MNKEKSVDITVLIAGRPYPLKIKEQDEPSVRDIVKELNEKINSFQLKYTQKDKQDCLAMVLLTYGVELNKAKSPTQDPKLNAKMNELDSIIDSIIEPS